MIVNDTLLLNVFMYSTIFFIKLNLSRGSPPMNDIWWLQLLLFLRTLIWSMILLFFLLKKQYLHLKLHVSVIFSVNSDNVLSMFCFNVLSLGIH